MTEDQKKPSPRRGGRPSRVEASLLEDKILDAAAAIFFSEGYGVASIEEIARRAQISKRTFYVRFENKAAVFKAVVHRVLTRIRPSRAATDKLFQGATLEESLLQVAHVILRASLTPEALSLQRVVVTEAMRFPELALILSRQGSRSEAIGRIGDLLQSYSQMDKASAVFSAEQFLAMVVTNPQRKAMGIGTPLTEAELITWEKRTVELFLKGVTSQGKFR